MKYKIFLCSFLGTITIILFYTAIIKIQTEEQWKQDKEKLVISIQSKYEICYTPHRHKP